MSICLPICLTVCFPSHLFYVCLVCMPAYLYVLSVCSVCLLLSLYVIGREKHTLVGVFSGEWGGSGGYGSVFPPEWRAL